MNAYRLVQITDAIVLRRILSSLLRVGPKRTFEQNGFDDEVYMIVKLRDRLVMHALAMNCTIVISV